MGGRRISDQMAEVEEASSQIAYEVMVRNWDFILSSNSTLVVQWKILSGNICI